MTVLTKGDTTVRSIFGQGKPRGRSIFENRKSANCVNPEVLSPDEVLWDIDEVAKYLKCCRRTAMKAVSRCKVTRWQTPGTRIIRYRRSDIAAMFKAS
jgi:hypothetical protein